MALSSIDLDAVGARARTAMIVPLGAASPLWFAYGAAASAGAAWWWMTRWAKPINAEAVAAAVSNALEARASVVEILAEYEHELELETAKIAADTIETFSHATEPTAMAPLPPVAAPAPLAPPDDLTVLVGIGPKLAQGLADIGVTRFAQIAAWTLSDLANVDETLGLKGRAVRDAWVAQAKRLAAGDA
jgi:predicted flap endonuclease-1-like 5' DNA nuclease